jgi:hypothetical protein
MSEEIRIHKKLSLDIFEYSRVNNIRYVKIFGITIYKQVANVKKLFFFVWGKNG